MKQIAGIDMGTTLIKVAYADEEGNRHFVTAHPDFMPSPDPNKPMTTKAEALGLLADELRLAGVTEARLTGTGVTQGGTALRNLLGSKIKARTSLGDPIADEIALQSVGVSRLLQADGKRLNDYLLISCGSGTSYTTVRGNRVERHPIGNPIGGGFIRGMATMAGIDDELLRRDPRSGGTSRDVVFADVFPHMRGQAMGNLVVSLMAGVTSDEPDTHKAATILHAVAALLARDVMQMASVPDNVVVIGTPVSLYPKFGAYLHSYLTQIGKTSCSPANSEYACALGAMLELGAEQEKE